MRLKVSNQSGILMVELLITIAVFAIMAVGAVYFLSTNVYSAQSASARTKATLYLQEGVEAVQTIDKEAWNYLADEPDNEYGLEKTTQSWGDQWTLVADPDNPDADPDYTRTVTIADVYRDSTSNDIVDSGDANAVLDPYTRFITVLIEWNNGPVRSSELSSSQYVTLWDDESEDIDLDTEFAVSGAGSLTDVRISTIDDGELQIELTAMEVGTFEADATWQTVTLDNTYTNPVVVTSILGVNNTNSPVSSRVKNAGTGSFEVRLDYPTDNFAPDDTSSGLTETVYYLVIEEGAWTLGDNSTKIEAGIVENVSDLACSTCGSWNVGTDVAYELTYASGPIVFAQLMTENDATSWLTSFVSDDDSSGSPPGTDGFQVALNGAEATSSYSTTEDIGYVVIEREVEDVFEGLNFETDVTGDVVTGYGSPTTESLDQTYGATPWALVEQQTMDGGNGGWPMLDDISTTDIAMYVDEDQANDSERAHTTEDFAYLVMAEEGTYYVEDAVAAFDYPTMEVGVIEPVVGTDTGVMEIGTTTASTAWSTITLSNTYTDPVVVVSSLDDNNSDSSAGESPFSTRVRNASGNSFQVRLDFPIDNGSTPTSANSETVYYMVVEAGNWELSDGTLIEADVVDAVSGVACNTCTGGGWEQGETVTYANSYSAAPLVFHQVMSENDSDWITSYVSSSTVRSTPPGSSDFRVALNAAQVTTSNTHAAEDIGYIVIERDIVSTADSINFETDLTADTVQGYDNTHYTETFDNTYISAPWVMITQHAMDGADGSWAILDSISTSQVEYYVMEDRYSDNERWHTTEETGFVAFASTGSFTLTDSTIDTDPITVSLQQTYTNPVVVTLPYFLNDADTPVSIRVYDVQSDAFTMAFDFPTDNFSPSDTMFRDDVYYIVMESGQWQMGDTKVEAGVESSVSTVANTSSWTGDNVIFDHSFDGDPLVLHQVMSNDDTDWITSWVSAQGDRTNPPDTSGMQIALNAAQVTTSNSHGPEDIGWIAFDDVGTDTYAGVEFRTEFGNEAIQGHANGCNTYTHGGTYADSIPLASQITMDGADGGWISLCSLSSTDVGLQTEEDQYSDSERSHTTEDYGLIVFEEAFDVAGVVNTSNQLTGVYESDVIDISGTGRNFNLLAWTEQIDCTNCDVTIQVRTAATAADVSSATYVGPDGTSTTSFDSPEGDLLHIDHISDEFLQYMITLDGTTSGSPIFEDLVISIYGN